MTDKRRVGRSDLTVSTVGLGCNNFGMRLDRAASTEVVHAALDAGITFFDTADIYGGGESEEHLGAALGARRREVVVATKFGAPVEGGPDAPRGSRDYVSWACEASLRRLGTDYIDLYYLHYPDPSTPVEETLAALDELVTAGKVRYVGSSNFAGWQVADAAHVAARDGRTPFSACQVEWNLLRRSVEREVQPACLHHGVGLVAYYPLASGLLTGKYRRGEPFPSGSRLDVLPYFRDVATDDHFAVVDRLSAVAARHGRTLTELACSWVAAQAGVSSVLVGATSAAQVTHNAAAADWLLSEEDLREVEDALKSGGSPEGGG